MNNGTKEQQRELGYEVRQPITTFKLAAEGQVLSFAGNAPHSMHKITSKGIEYSRRGRKLAQLGALRWSSQLAGPVRQKYAPRHQCA